MSQHFLDEGDVGVFVQQVGGVAVTQSVNSTGLVDFSFFLSSRQDLLHATGVVGFSTPAEVSLVALQKVTLVYIRFAR